MQIVVCYVDGMDRFYVASGLCVRRSWREEWKWRVQVEEDRFSYGRNSTVACAPKNPLSTLLLALSTKSPGTHGVGSKVVL